jgi:hypothetical protein
VDEDVIIVVVLQGRKIVLQVSKGTVQAPCQTAKNLKPLQIMELSKLNLLKPCNLQERAVAGGRYAFPLAGHERCVSFANMKFYLGSVQRFLGKMPALP